MPLRLPPITRRQFVAGSLAASAVMLLAERLPAADRRVDARLHADGVTLVLNTLNKKDPANGETVQLRWKT